jgi:1,4-dihydroxy-2-naphthoate octaprenyltransferase
VGLVYATVTYGPIASIPVAAALVSALFIQIATNLANDAADGDSGADKAERLGPVRLVGAGILSASQVRRGAVASSLAAAAFGLVAVIHGGTPILAIGLASLLAAWGYSYGPWPICASPFGEVFVILFFGAVATTDISHSLIIWKLPITADWSPFLARGVAAGATVFTCGLLGNRLIGHTPSRIAGL